MDDILIRFFKYLRNTENSLNKAKNVLAMKKKFNKCSYSKGNLLQNAYLCITCEKEVGICAGCYLNCHKTHEVIELGPKNNFRCCCGLGTTDCKLTSIKKVNNNPFFHNFTGKFCVCDTKDSENRDSDMHLCINCFDWFHASCIQIYNDCHNLADKKYHQANAPIIPKDTDNYFFVCESCLQDYLYIPSLYLAYIALEKSVQLNFDHQRTCIVKYPYHVFIHKS
jgi:Putative zinc finger in N-recognin (UBR box).